MWIHLALGMLLQAPQEPARDPGAETGLTLEGLRPLHRIDGSRGEHFGAAIHVLPDVNGDGASDLAIYSRPWVRMLTTGTGTLDVHCGRSGERLYHVAPAENGRDAELENDPFGQRVLVVGDASGDAVPDYWVLGGGSWIRTTTYQHLVSGADGTRLVRLGLKNSLAFLLPDQDGGP